MAERERAFLALEDGSVYAGWSVGARVKVAGEVVFNTSMTGYQEMLTDPSYRGEIVVMTYPLIGNYGVNDEDLESEQPHPRGLVVSELCGSPSNFRARERLSDYLARHGVAGIEGVDTRALTRRLRERGTMRGVIAAGQVDPAFLVEEAKAAPDISSQDLVDEVCTRETYLFADGSGPRVTVVDYGVKANILRSLAERGCRVTVVSGRSGAAEVLATRPDGVVLSNGPGDPRSIPFAVEAVKELIGRVPLFGICLGHQVVGLAFGGEIYKLKYGHRGANHPVKETESGRVHITSQNHSFALREGSWSDPSLIVSHRNVNDGTVEGLRHRELPVWTVQYHPEASPGPRDSAYLFDQFVQGLSRPA